MTSEQYLTKASIASLLALAFPIVVLTSSSSLSPFIDRFFLTRFSTEALQACTIGFAFVAVFQIACVRMATEAQVFVSQACSAGEERRVGVYVWQMIWLSFLSMFVTIPVGFVVNAIAFDSSVVQQDAREYFILMMWGNFLFPLTAALNAFYTGRGRLNVILICTGLLMVIHIPLAWMFINGFGSWIPAMGLKGAAIGVMLPQALYCMLLFILILRPKHRERFHTSNWIIRWRPLWASMRVGLFNGLSAALMAFSWTIVVKIVANTGNQDYLTIMAFGNSFALFFTFLQLGIGQAVSIIASGLIGVKAWAAIRRLIGSTTVVVSVTLLFQFPLLVLFPDFLLGFFFPNFPDQFSPELAQMLRYCCKTLWLFEVAGGVDRTTRGLLTAAGDTVFMFFVYVLSLFFITCIPVYLAIEVWQWSPGKFWLIMTSTILLRNVPLIWRLMQERWKISDPILAS